MNIYNKHTKEVLESFRSSEAGLSNYEAGLRLTQYGKNIIFVKGESWYKKLFEPFKSVFVLILIIAGLISLYQGENIDAVIIAGIILISAFIFYAQSWSTQRVLNTLKKHNKQLVKTFRDNQIVQIDSEYLVPGDVVVLAEGEKIPADCRIIHSENLRCDEALLTGESKPVSKQPHALKAQKEIYEQDNMLFQGTFAVSGTVKALVVATGNGTEFGRIAKLSAKVQSPSPVQQKIDKLVTQIVIAISIVAVITLMLSILRGISFAESIRFVFSLTVSAVPEGLPVAISVILALGMNRMAKKKALVRSMPAIENIGTVTLIATDKTGTLTKNKLTVQDIWQLQETDLAVTCEVIRRSVNSKNGVMHDPLDQALNIFASKYSRQVLSEPVKVLPFELSFAMSGNVYQNQDDYQIFIKGAPEKIIENSLLNNDQKQQIHQQLLNMTGQGFRVIAFAQNRTSHNLTHFKDLQPNMEFVALVAVADELRRESKSAIKKALDAGVKVCMITGDHFETAFAIGKNLGLVINRNQVIDSRDFGNLDDTRLEKIIKDVRVFARVTPENKFRLLEIFKKKEITAMTGDGVNDVPALVNAHIGIAMGSGSQIAKDAGDIVLLDDNFNSIINALKEGRKIYDNIRRMLFYLLSTNLGEVMIMIGALVIGLPLPIVAVQILWVNLVTDTCLVIPLGLEPSEQDVLKRPPRRAKKAVLGRRSITRLIIIASFMTIIGLTLFNYFLQNNSLDYARTIAFTSIVVMQWANAFNARSEEQSIFKRLNKLNKSFLVGLPIAIILQYMAIYGPLQTALHAVPVSIGDLLLASVISFTLIIFVDEIFKLLYKTKNNPKYIAQTNIKI